MIREETSANGMGGEGQTSQLPCLLGWDPFDVYSTCFPEIPYGIDLQLSSVVPCSLKCSVQFPSLSVLLLHSSDGTSQYHILPFKHATSTQILSFGGTQPKSVGPRSDARKETIRIRYQNWITCWSDDNEDPVAIDNLWHVLTSLLLRVLPLMNWDSVQVYENALAYRITLEWQSMGGDGNYQNFEVGLLAVRGAMKEENNRLRSGNH